MLMQKLVLAVAASLALTSAAYAQSARDQIDIVGSSTVYPFATAVAGEFGKATPFKAPKIESTGSGGGLEQSCAGVGVDYLKKAHVGVVPGLEEYVAGFTSDKAFGPEGYLVGKGLIPMPEAMREQVRVSAAALKALEI